MSREDVPLSVLDLVPVSSGGSAAGALRNTLDLARRAEEFGYRRYWVAEHHAAPGVAGSAPALVLSMIAGVTGRIRIGSGAVQLGHHTPLSVVEQFGMIDALHPGRVDLGLGRSGGGSGPPGGGPAARPAPRSDRYVDGLLVPAPYPLERYAASPRFAAQSRLLNPSGAAPQDYGRAVDDIAALIAGTYVSPEGVDVHAVPGEGAALQVWVFGSSAGESARVAGARGLRFAANYHASPGTVLDAVGAYLAAFRPSAELARPHVLVSADVLVAQDDATARRLADGFEPWVRSIRADGAAMRYPAPGQAAGQPWTDEDRALVADRVRTRFTGSPKRVVDGLRALRRATGADELLITTLAHDHADRVRSYELLARAWESERA
ncbi:LLM class flavin-dependent oxidoreductase [Streptomyces marincola]|uniref:LLM class flavin-dependent oxidoreductase n=1 Tax=Streptomyces marincola TaxID=2878388 RepID=UPI001CF51BF4|nr:LLM class flavin-dependent oxidoreductase [Streptomyces marincola]UCM91181.1 LLM class flavin-dependent oxidoreductase [Streptomyces marincola]